MLTLQQTEVQTLADVLGLMHAGWTLSRDDSGEWMEQGHLCAVLPPGTIERLEKRCLVEMRKGKYCLTPLGEFGASQSDADQEVLPYAQDPDDRPEAVVLWCVIGMIMVVVFAAFYTRW
ncbi:MAG: hypothetical protein JNJ77_19875 [Planctomycetia bacterium]|nr:hypothetical protein [Planctomycetia bacterium]